MSLLETWSVGSHTAEDLNGETLTYPTYRKGSGPGVIVIHEIPGMTPPVIGFAEELVDAGYTVVMPLLFGRPEVPDNAVAVATTIRKLCVSREMSLFAKGSTQPVAGWLRSLAGELHHELGGAGVGALGMCFTGGFALAMMVDDSLAAPVLCQPSAPFPVTPGRGADINLSPADLTRVKERAAAGCEVLGVRYAKDPATGTRFETLTRELGEAFLKVELPGRKHSTVTRHRSQEAVDRILGFFSEKLAPAPS